MVTARLLRAAHMIEAASVDRFAAQCATRSTRVWFATDPDFPIRDAEFHEGMPSVLLGEGRRPEALAAPRVAIVGTRAATPIGLDDAHELGAVLARAGVTVISGLAIGIDGAAHEGALAAGGLTVGVVATGLDVVYPRRHSTLFTRVRDNGMIVGEHDFGVQPLPWRFPIRNRIIAALADAIVVVEATRTGGARITAGYAHDFDRKLYEYRVPAATRPRQGATSSLPRARTRCSNRPMFLSASASMRRPKHGRPSMCKTPISASSCARFPDTVQQRGSCRSAPASRPRGSVGHCAGWPRRGGSNRSGACGGRARKKEGGPSV
jgi:DNA protecting protein DprA